MKQQKNGLVELKQKGDHVLEAIAVYQEIINRIEFTIQQIEIQ